MADSKLLKHSYMDGSNIPASRKNRIFINMVFNFADFLANILKKTCYFSKLQKDMEQLNLLANPDSSLINCSFCIFKVSAKLYFISYLN